MLSGSFLLEGNIKQLQEDNAINETFDLNCDVIDSTYINKIDFKWRNR